ncbi:hypothetical protein T02_1852 [Trichinella nativa]|uniref:Uncharacterized protein n=1 Tax=Trichinella nativa TaxID=6335 RepID=A0A0V1LFY0_9BILA|nr:hypothetical protein T02_1852 [Trichinella nativa]
MALRAIPSVLDSKYITPFVNIGLEQGSKGREFQHLPFKFREGHLRQPPVTGPNSRPASTNIVTVDGAFSARLDHPGARSRFPHSVALTICRPVVYRGLTLLTFQV